MGIRNLLILFFSSIAISLVFFITFFSLFFKNVEFGFDTRIPETAPSVKQPEKAPSISLPKTRYEQKRHATLNVPTASKNIAKPLPTQEVQEDNPTPTTKAIPSPKLPEKKAEIPTKKPEKPPLPTLITPSKPSLPVSPPALSSPAGKKYQVYIDGFSSEAEARKKVESLSKQGFSPFLKRNGGSLKVQLGVFSDRANAMALSKQAGAKMVEVQ